MSSHWFPDKKCTLIGIKQYKSISDHRVERSIKIEDLQIIKSLMDRMDKIPPNGEMMISFSGNAEQVDLIFHFNEQLLTVNIIEKSFKTPSTGFNSKNELELSLYREIHSLLFADSNKKV